MRRGRGGRSGRRRVRRGSKVRTGRRGKRAQRAKREKRGRNEWRGMKEQYLEMALKSVEAGAVLDHPEDEGEEEQEGQESMREK